jgi:hypothetical protein
VFDSLGVPYHSTAEEPARKLVARILFFPSGAAWEVMD